MPPKRRLYLVELFSGTKSVSRAIRRSSIGHSFDVRVLSVDNLPKFDPDVCVDINEWNFERDIDAFLRDRRKSDIVACHASPPCTEFSRALTTRPRDLRAGSKTVKSALRIMAYLESLGGKFIWTLENPHTGLLKDQPFMNRGMQHCLNVACYCKYGFAYKKPTAIWSNINNLDLKVCDSQTPCPAKKKYGRHLAIAQSGPSRTSPGSGGSEYVYGIPARLVIHIFKRGCSQAVGN